MRLGPWKTEIVNNVPVSTRADSEGVVQVMIGISVACRKDNWVPSNHRPGAYGGFNPEMRQYISVELDAPVTELDRGDVVQLICFWMKRRGVANLQALNGVGGKALCALLTKHYGIPLYRIAPAICNSSPTSLAEFIVAEYRRRNEKRFAD